MPDNELRPTGMIPSTLFDLTHGSSRTGHVRGVVHSTTDVLATCGKCNFSCQESYTEGDSEDFDRMSTEAWAKHNSGHPDCVGLLTFERI